MILKHSAYFLSQNRIAALPRINNADITADITNKVNIIIGA